MKNFTPSYLVVDLGNTALKFGLFIGESVHFGRSYEELVHVVNQHHFDYSLISSVSTIEFTNDVKKIVPNALLFSQLNIVPIQNLYATPDTLGYDRIANAVAIMNAKDSGAALSIDIGTCLKFDFVDNTGAYIGGSISPGLRMRFRALHEYTANLPLIVSWDDSLMIGQDTHSSLVSGVVEGMTNEINETIRRYQERCENLTIYLTGGDSVYFENAINYRIFADPNLTLKGLKIILEANV